jgi:hypothetical protein
MKLSALAVLGFTLAVFAGPLGCGDSGTGGSSAGGSSAGGSSSTSCESFFECTNGVCECTTDGKTGQSCDEATCEDDCEVCS